ncbi:Callose synthase 11 [Bienertia sinuspersici]
MAHELNYILDDRDDPETGRPYLPLNRGENAFLDKVVTPLYDTIKMRSFDRFGVVVVGLASHDIVALEGQMAMGSLGRRHVQVKLLTIFISWAGLRLLQSILDAGTQYSLVTRREVVARNKAIDSSNKGTLEVEGSISCQRKNRLTEPVINVVHKLRDAVHRLKLRYGLGQPYKKIESSQVEATRFALLWNEILKNMREEDLLSDGEVEVLELSPNCWEIRVIRWPCTCAIIEAYDSIKYLLLNQVIMYGTEEHSIVSTAFLEMEHYMSIEKFTAFYKLTLLPQIHRKLVTLIDLLLKPKKEVGGIINVLQALYELCVRDFTRIKRSTEELRQNGLALQDPAGFLFENAITLPDDEDVFYYRQLRRLHTLMTSRDSMHNVPINLEARRRIAFFSNSVFMNMPHAPKVEKMLSFSVLTPYYDEDVIYGTSKLQSPNEDGISILFYLQKIYEDEWNNFMERMRREGLDDEREIWTTKVKDLRLWASYRGQTLSRTVRGMMYHYQALKMLAYLDSASEIDIRTGSVRVPSSRNLGRSASGVSILYKGHEFGTAMMKFTYVVTCQVYGIHKMAGDSRAEEILYLMKNNEALRVAYVDEVHRSRDEVEYYSVLVKYDQQQQREVEIYRIKLPGPVKLGGGKPENQNHAIIFTRGDALQTIDMNQDNSFEEALKMRNLLEEFNKNFGIRKPTILGVRENIFTGSVSSLAWFMSAQETSFVTLGQRVLAKPLKVRMHYGHPDVLIGFGFSLEIAMFEAKVASGNGEQVLSRDVYRLGHRLDFFRMLSVFYSTGHAVKNSNNNAALGAIVNQQFIIQIGVFTALPMIVENSLEHGFLPAIWDFLKMQLQLASLFYTFSMGTRCHYFGRTILHGGAKYRATGRGFVVQHKKFAENYRLYSRSHFVKAIELGVILTVYASHSPLATNTFVYIAMSISSWFLVVSWVMAPFVFNPSGFDWLKTVYDFEDFITWIWFGSGVSLRQIGAGKPGGMKSKNISKQLLNIADGKTSIGVYFLSWLYFFAVIGICVVVAYARDKYGATKHIYFRMIQFSVISVTVLVIVIFLKFTKFEVLDLLTSSLAFIPTVGE